jgi:ribosomal protein S3AE
MYGTMWINLLDEDEIRDKLIEFVTESEMDYDFDELLIDIIKGLQIYKSCIIYFG